MANWTRATLLDRLTQELSESGMAAPESTPDQIVDDPTVLGEVLASEVIELLKSAVVREAMGRKSGK